MSEKPIANEDLEAALKQGRDDLENGRVVNADVVIAELRELDRKDQDD